MMIFLRTVNSAFSSGIFLLAVLTLSGCASGGNQNPAPTPPVSSLPPPAPPPPPNFNTVEYQTQPALAQINALAAYDRGTSGANVIVAVIDSGIDENNAEFAGRIHPQSADLVIAGIVNPSDVRSGGPNLEDEDDHGTPVASIIAAARNDVGVHGVAPLSQLLVFRTDDNSTSDSALLGAAISEGVDRAAAHGAGVLNFSFGSDDAIARAEFANTLTFTKQNDIVTVLSAGNDGDPEPDPSALGALDVPGDPAAIIAGAVNSSNQIASFSNQAGAGANIFLAAPGVGLRTTFQGAAPGETRSFSGTSAATPVIAGAAALIRSLWPQLSATEVVDILLTTATDLGTPGVDPVYGRGLLNLEAATAPTGAITTSSISGQSIDLEEISVQLSDIYGGSAFENFSVVGFDRYNRDFRISLDQQVSRAKPAQFSPERQLSLHSRQQTKQFSRSSRLHGLFRISSHNLLSAGSFGPELATPLDLQIDDDFTSENLSTFLMVDLAEKKSIAFSQGFSGKFIDKLYIPQRQTPFLNSAAFSDQFLPDTNKTVTNLFQARMWDLSFDFLFAHSAKTSKPNFELNPKSVTAPPAKISVFRAGAEIPLDSVELRIEQGLRVENGEILGARFGPEGSSTTIYSAIDAVWRLADELHLHGRLARGITFAAADNFGGFAENVSEITTTQFSGAISKTNALFKRDQLWIGVAQPLQIESGAITFVTPVAYDFSTDTIRYSEYLAPLNVSGRRLNYEVGYTVQTKQMGSISVNLLHQTFADSDLPASTALVFRAGYGF